MKILQTMAGGDVGGAEEFFVRLASAFETRGLEQTVVVRPNEKRNPVLRAAGIDPIQLPFRGWLDFRTVRALAAEIAGKKPDIILSWMSRASAARPTC